MPPAAGALHAAPGCSGACPAAPDFLLNGFLLNGFAPKNRRYHRPASAPAGTALPPAEEAEVRQGEARAPEPAVPEPAELRQPPAGGAGTAPGSGALQIPGSARGSVPGSEQDPASAAERYHRAVPASAGSASGSSPRPVLADWVPGEGEPADSSPGSAVAAAVAIPAV